jgi:nicotinamide mononucleotide transporter
LGLVIFNIVFRSVCQRFFDARLYGDMGLQWVFIIVSVWGWFLWWRGIDGSSQLPVSALGESRAVLAVIAWGLGFAALAWFLKNLPIPMFLWRMAF